MGEENFNVQKIKDGNLTAFRSFMDMYSKDLYCFAYGYIGNREISEEVVSDVFLEVWNNRSRLDEISYMKSWLLVMVRNAALSYLRKERMGNTVAFDEIEDFHLPAVQSPDQEIISKEEIQQIHNVIASLPPKCKEVFMLAKIEKMPYKEIADILNISIKTINIHVAKAKRLIAEILHEDFNI